MLPAAAAGRDDRFGPPPRTAPPDFDIPLADPAATVAKIKAAVDRVLQASPVAAQGFKTLSGAGQIRIVYDAVFPERSLSRVIVAAFLVGEFRPQDGKPDFDAALIEPINLYSPEYGAYMQRLGFNLDGLGYSMHRTRVAA